MEPALLELARRYGIETSYHRVSGERCDASEEALMRVLRVLGVPIEGPEEAPDLLRHVLAAREDRPEPVRVAWDGGPEGLEPGYHDVEVEAAGGLVRQLVISAPTRVFGADETHRTWTAFLPLYALRKASDLGAGDFTGLAALRETVAELGGAGVAVLPLCAAYLDVPFEPSPYSPASRLFLNEFYTDPAAAPEVAISPDARALLDSPEFRAEVEELRALEFAEPFRIMALKRRVLELLARDLLASSSTRREEFLRYVGRRSALADYATFRAAVERKRATWPQWSSPARDGKLGPEDYDPAVRDVHLYAQWLAEGQLAATAGEGRAELHLDMPLGAMTDSYDVWRHRGLFALGAGGGAPPDLLCPDGQDWGFPPLHPEAIRRDDYRYFRACLARLMEPADSLRIDHVMGLSRLFFVPQGMPASEGVYVRYPAEELYAVLSLESHRHRCRLVGENLGTVPPEVNYALEKHGIRGMYVLPFETRPNPRYAFERVPAGAQACLATHDMEPFAAWWKNLPGHDRETMERFLDLAGFGDEPPHAACLSFLAASRAGEVVLGLEDLWGEERRQNLPGTGAEKPNFRRRATKALEEIRQDPEIRVRLERLAALRRQGEGALKAGVGPVRPVPGHITDTDLYLLAEGSHLRLAEKLGSHSMTQDGAAGAHFAVWAPNAERVSVTGDFNGWDPGIHVLSPLGSSGVWAGFVPGARRGDLYKYRVVSRHRGYVEHKADPLALRHETPPHTASVVWDLDYEWGDEEWMAGRAEINSLDAPVSVYELHLGSFMRVPEEGGRFLTYRELAPKLAAHMRATGFTHVEFLPVMEHPFYGSWGYQVTGYFAPTSRYGTPEDFAYLVDHLHQAGIGVILDWVPSHFPRDGHGLGYFDGTHLYEHADPRRGLHPDWDSLIFNYDRNEVRSFLLSAALHWLRVFHVDGLRTDAVASMLYLDYSRKAGEWIPNEQGGRENTGAISLLKRLNEEVYREFPDVQTIAEESTAWPMVSRPVSGGGLGFGMKWDMGWMHDTLEYMKRDPIHRRHHHGELTFRQIYAATENFMLSLSHDEVVHGKGSLIGKMPGDAWQQFANLRLLYAYMFAQSGKKLLFMSCEIAQWAEWAHEGSVEWHLLEFGPHRGIRDLVAELNRLYRSEPALFTLDFDPAGFEWIEGNDADNSVLSFIRRGRKGEVVLVVCHFTPILREGYRVGVPAPGRWREILNTDEERFGGAGNTNAAPIASEPTPWSGRDHSIALTVPPLGAVWLVPEDQRPAAT